MPSGRFTIAHLTDPHLGSLPPFGPRHWNLKRGLGWLNWMRSRRHAHLSDVLERIVSGRTKSHQLHELLAWNWKAARERTAQAAA